MTAGALMDPERVAWRLGLAIRRARLRRGWPQLELAVRTGISTSVLSRMELGLGSNVPLQTWTVVTAALDLGAIWLPAPGPAWGVDQVTRLATVGGWEAQHADPSPTLILERAPHLIRRPFGPRMTPGEVAVVHVVEVLTNAIVVRREMDAGIARALVGAQTGWAVAGLLVVRRIEANKRRVGSMLAGFAPDQPGRWIAALNDREVPMPRHTGFVWMDARATRLIPRGLRLRNA